MDDDDDDDILIEMSIQKKLTDNKQTKLFSINYRSCKYGLNLNYSFILYIIVT